MDNKAECWLSLQILVVIILNILLIVHNVLVNGNDSMVMKVLASLMTC